jgi:tetratricopeptide (TPR) repeat protein
VGDPDLKTFYLPPLAAEFLRRKRPEAIGQTGDRLTDRAYVLALVNGFQNFERFSVLEAEWPTVAAALPRLAQGNNDRLQKVCLALDKFLQFSGRSDELLTLTLQAEENALTAKDFYNAGSRAYEAGWVYSLRTQAKEVMACATRCADHLEKAPKAGAREKAFAIRLRGMGHELATNYPAAMEAYLEALNLFKSMAPESENVAVALNDLAELEHLQGDYAAAERDFREGQRIAEKIGNREMIAGIPGNLASLALVREDWAGAETLAREALELAEKVGRQDLIAADCFRLAKALARQGKAAEGQPYARRAVEIFTKLRQPDNLERAQAALKECGG